MKTISRLTPEQLYAEIAGVTRQLSEHESADLAESWNALADLCERKRGLWRQLADIAGDDHQLPLWAIIAAYTAADHCCDHAERYREYAREALRKQADAA